MLSGFVVILITGATAMMISADCIATEYSPRAGSEPALRDSVNVFISGHSLVDQPIPDYLSKVASSLGTPLKWNRQYLPGSSIATRTRGPDLGSSGWGGYRTGVDRAGEKIDALTELKSRGSIGNATYDALVITEQHGLLQSLAWNDTVRYLRHYHDRLIESNPAATTYFYESWLGLGDKDQPQRWVAYERAASPIWQCIATRINISLAAEGRTDRIQSLPAGLALANLIDRAIQAPGVPSVTLASVRSTVDSLVKDDVHLTELGSYYAALVTYATLYGRSPFGAWHPQGVDKTAASSLQHEAWSFVGNHARSHVPLTLEQCRDTLRKSFIDRYWGYVRDVSWRKDLNVVHAYLRWARHVVQWQWLVWRDVADNPFYLDPAFDRGHWLPPP